MLIIIVAILTISIVALKLKHQHKSREENLASKVNNTKKLAEQSGIDPDELTKAAGLEKPTTEGESETKENEPEENITESTICARYPDENGNCDHRRC